MNKRHEQNYRKYLATGLFLSIMALCEVNCVDTQITFGPINDQKNQPRTGVNWKNTEDTMGSESGWFCPTGYLFHTLYRMCVSSKEGLGPFSDTMIKACLDKKNDPQICNSNLWPLDLAKSLRGTGECLPGTSLDNTLGVCAVDSYIFGPFPADLLEVCQKATNNDVACQTMRWNRKILSDAGITANVPSIGTNVGGNTGAGGGSATSGSDGFDSVIDTVAPESQGQKLTVWATWYNLPTAEHVSNGIPLRALSGDPLGPVVDQKNWCFAAMEGSVRIKNGPAAGKTFNYSGSSSDYKVSCEKYFDHPASGKAKFREAKGQFGDGVLGYRLVPYRTIAVDPARIPFGTVLYIPSAKGLVIKKPDGKSIVHDGYFFAGDAGGLIKGNHIDVFVAEFQDTPFPFVKSSSEATFSAFVIKDTNVARKLRLLHMF